MRMIKWQNGTVITPDQTKLPLQEVTLEIKTVEQMAEAIKVLRVRGAPLLGAAAGFGVALAAYHSNAKTRDQLLKELNTAGTFIKSQRPTAVNLFWGTDRVLNVAKGASGGVAEIKAAVIAEAQKIADEDAAQNRAMGKHGAKLIDSGDTILTHCNAGELATVEYGTALGVIRAAWEQGKKIKVIADETRPLLQGARLTAYELKRDGIPVTLITDNMAAYVMSKGLVQKVIVGADRIVQDAVFNKIGTYGVAVLAHEHGIPFYVAAPKSTFDLTRKAKDVEIEERKPEEVTHVGCQQTAPDGIAVYNPAFDATPLKYVAGIITESGVYTKKDFAKFNPKFPL
ncbi:MAG TPA: S-methyl-5-thioribose-1-phosphate isomerase [Candidatus Acidoferrales bacterium]|nr:S-methyl-5-thioribose-1-phosphate isomerase [Candidatus Acidoferrales bacterium]